MPAKEITQNKNPNKGRKRKKREQTTDWTNGK